MNYARRMTAEQLAYHAASKLPQDGQLHLVELYRTLQGEGLCLGESAIFLRLAYCNRRCSWCDTDWSERWCSSPEQLAVTINEMIGDRPFNDNVVITGGEPCLQAEALCRLIDAVIESRLVPGKYKPYVRWHLESNGTILHADLCDRMTTLIFSPKPPSSGLPYGDWPRLWSFLDERGRWTRAAIKVVIGSAEDMEFYTGIIESKERTLNVPFILQLVTDPHDDQLADLRARHRELLQPRFIEWMATYNVRLMPRLHFLVWGNEQGR